ncbi:MAG: ribbon-helix-helix domain-containing protein [Parvularculaceae bacterium]
MEKRSIAIAGHRTSVALEPAFWRALEEIAARRGVDLPSLIAEIDEARARQGAPAGGLASALRVFALETFRVGLRLGDEAD